jgi:thiamine biosynthesis lipoprotein
MAGSNGDKTTSTEIVFDAMGSTAQVIVVGGPIDAADTARRRIDQLEARWSRFRPTSEVSLLTEHAGDWVEVSADTVALVERSIEAWHLTGGSFDPTVLGDVIRAGYDGSFETIHTAPHNGRSRLLLGCTDIAIAGSRVRLPADTGFDPGGIGKGLAADLVVDEAIEAGVEGICVNLGGDLRVWGEAPGGGGWTVAVGHEWSPDPVVDLGLRRGAVATSTTLRRHWQVDGEARHHLIDPMTGLPSNSDLTSVTAIASIGWAAEVLAKAVLLRGSAHPFDLLGGTGVEALVVTDTGELIGSPGLEPFVRDRRLPGRIPAPLALAG